jgi:hypothetical protein
MVKFHIGDRPSDAANWLSIHLADDCQQSLCPGSKLQDVVSLVVELRSVDGDDPRVVGSTFKAQLPQSVRVHWRLAIGDWRLAIGDWRLAYRRWFRSFPDHGGMFVESSHSLLLRWRVADLTDSVANACTMQVKLILAFCKLTAYCQDDILNSE